MRRSAGFTLIELIMVMVILGITSAAMTPAFFGQGQFKIQAFQKDLMQGMRYAQLVAIARGCRVRVAIQTTGFSLLQDADCSSVVYNNSKFTQALSRPGDASTLYANTDLPAGSITEAKALVFNPDGTISRETSATALALESVYVITIGSFNVNVYGATGYIE